MRCPLVPLNPRGVDAAARPVDFAGHQLLAAARRPEQKHTDLRGPDLLDLGIEHLHAFACAEQLPQVISVFRRRRWRTLHGHRLLDHIEQAVGVGHLHQVVERPEASRLEREPHLGVAREHHDGEAGSAPSDLGHHRESFAVTVTAHRRRHHDVEENQPHVVGEMPQPFLPARGVRHRIAVQDLVQHVPEGLDLIVDDQDVLHSVPLSPRSCGCRRAKHYCARTTALQAPTSSLVTSCERGGGLARHCRLQSGRAPL